MEKKNKAGAVKTFKCHSCAGSVRLTAVGISTHAYCQSCGSEIDITDENFKIISEFKRKAVQTALPIGSRGTLSGIEWEVIGFQIKCDETEMYEWSEYLLFNPYHGFRFLVHSNGHWSFVKLIRKDVMNVAGRNNAEFEGRNYRVFLRGGAKVKYVMGEFYWEVKLNDRSQVADYICPPYMLSSELTDDELTWSLGEYIDRETIRESFGIKDGIAPAYGVAPNQLSPFKERQKGAWLLGVISIIAATLVYFIAATSAKNIPVYNSDITFYPYHKGTELVGDVFLSDGISNFSSRIYSPVHNNWVELDLALVNAQTNKRYDWRQGVSYYSGYDSDGRWTEGRQLSKEILSSVPGGHYKLIVSPDAGAFASGNPVDVRVDMARDVISTSNYFITILLILAYPLLLIVRSWNFERRRWEESDYAPAMYSSGESE